ncbi:MAG: hypothetical protein ACXWEI_05280 [Mycobacterium sp.]
MSSKANLSFVLIAAVIVFLTVACGGSTTRDSTSAPVTATPGSPSPGTGQPATAKVSANTASKEQIEAALRDAGVSNPARWAEEVLEYRPYPSDDPNLTKLRDNLAKYNPGQQTIDKIVSALSP